MSSMEYRPEVDGLRAIAIVPVVLFHAGVEIFSGGFIGVDVFFVISGYLISSIIYKEMTEGKFSLARFYERRAKRIIPPLLVVVAFSCLMSVFFMDNIQKHDFYQSLISVATFSSNFLFWMETGYFEQASELKPLLHTWSLSVEEQFYIVFPLLLLFVTKFRYRTIMSIIVALSILSLIIAEMTLQRDPSASFYLPMSRAWELLAGSILAMFPNVEIRKRNNWISLAALLGLTAAIFVYDASVSFPGISAVPVIIATGLIIRYAHRGTWAAQVLSVRPFVFIGSVSYSLYLWHQPLFAFARLNYGTHPSLWLMLSLCALAFIFSVISLKFIENPFRNGSFQFYKGTQKVIWYSTFSLIVMAGFGLVQTMIPHMRQTDNLSQIDSLKQITDSYMYFDYTSTMRKGICHSVSLASLETNSCIEKGHVNIAIIGDSYAAALYSGLNSVRADLGESVGISQMTNGNGPPFIRTDRFIDGDIITVAEATSNSIKILTDLKPNYVILSWLIGGRSSYGTAADDAAAIKETILAIKEISPQTKFIVVGPAPQWDGNLLNHLIAEYDEYNVIPDAYLSRGLNPHTFSNDAFLKGFDWGHDVKFLSIVDILCKESTSCLAYINDLSHISTIDWGHLTVDGSKFVFDKLKQQIMF